MGTPEEKPLEVLEVGSYSQLSVRPNPHQNKIVFIPSLAALLIAAEKKSGRALLETEVEVLRDHATVAVMPPEEAVADPAIRLYDDIDPNNIWEDWIKIRARL